MASQIKKCPRISGAAQPLLTIRLFDGVALIGETSTDAAGVYAFRPTTDLVQGQHLITAVAVNGPNVSAPSLPLSLMIDSTKPAVTTSFGFDSNRQKLDFNFSESLYGLPVVTDLTVQNLTTDTQIPTADISLTADAIAGTATFSFPGLTYGALPDGNHLAILLGSAVTDIAGNHPSSPMLHPFVRGPRRRFCRRHHAGAAVCRPGGCFFLWSARGYWSMTDTRRTDMCAEALEMALETGTD